jgi:hypothetical protein
VGEILAAADLSADFYFDSAYQDRTDRWSNGRIAPMGDAAFCPRCLPARVPRSPWQPTTSSPAN